MNGLKYAGETDCRKCDCKYYPPSECERHFFIKHGATCRKIDLMLMPYKKFYIMRSEGDLYSVEAETVLKAKEKAKEKFNKDVFFEKIVLERGHI
jgi:hypothetical protein